ncbi:Uncharacterised protein [Segatella buccae]|uniref:Uncharacterized protein n=1 Tax=Segatella buccae TaxID=28126 RepID=A0AAQ1UHZ4_9BACT|nr:Uncharacterised protein [Segatella buccae]
MYCLTSILIESIGIFSLLIQHPHLAIYFATYSRWSLVLYFQINPRLIKNQTSVGCNLCMLWDACIGRNLRNVKNSYIRHIKVKDVTCLFDISSDYLICYCRDHALQ